MDATLSAIRCFISSLKAVVIFLHALILLKLAGVTFSLSLTAAGDNAAVSIQRNESGGARAAFTGF